MTDMRLKNHCTWPAGLFNDCSQLVAVTATLASALAGCQILFDIEPPILHQSDGGPTMTDAGSGSNPVGVALVKCPKSKRISGIFYVSESSLGRFF
ncbi:MAG: hypothetical protein MJE77_43025, partial [Proteobacteria bacterium]|nr:hypothetical protein [Pseudomonadota bacterium]